MFYHDKKLQYDVKVEKANPAFARILQQATDDIEVEIHVALAIFVSGLGKQKPC